MKLLVVSYATLQSLSAIHRNVCSTPGAIIGILKSTPGDMIATTRDRVPSTRHSSAVPDNRM